MLVSNVEGVVHMRKNAISLGRIFGIPVVLDYSWFLIFALVTWSLATSYFPAEFTTWPAMEYWIVAAVTAILFFASVLLHELGHSVIAIRYKILVRKITLFIFGGIAQIASEPPSAAAEFWIAIAGPLVSFALAGLFAGLQLVSAGFAPLLALAKYLAYINGMLGLFNLIPGFPLDGGRVFRALVWGITHNYHRATTIASILGRVISLLFILAGIWMTFSGNLINGLWIIFIGWFLDSAANAQLSQMHLHDMLAGHIVGQAMTRNYAVLPVNITLQQIADEHILGAGRRIFVIEDQGEVAGLLTLANMNSVPRSEWATTTAAQAMTPVDKIHLLKSDTGLSEALDEMDLEKVNQLPVMADNQVIGILSRESVVNFLRTLQELSRQKA
jgi:Zn-dependent protease